MGTDVRPKRVIAHLDCDAFYVSVELLRRPDLRDKAVIVAYDGPRSVVTTASYAARRYGVGSAMPLSRARRLCPHAILLPPNFDAYRATSRQLWTIVRERLGALQHLGLDEAYADLTGVEKPLRVLRELIADVREQTGITVSVGVAPSRLVAKVCSELGKPAGFVAMGREEAARRFAGNSPKLLPGIGPKSVERLREMGIETIGQLQQTPLERLTERFGTNHGADLLRRAHFHDDSPVTTEQVLKSRSNELTFNEDVESLSELEEILRGLAAELCEGLRRREKRGRTIAIKVRLDDWTTVTRARSIDTHTHDAQLVTDVALELLRAYAPPRPVRLLGVRIASFEDEGAMVAQAAPSAQLALPL
ncbi:DNA polymerase IV [Conexibacter sp. CPCC 206217]|uniref:DNA polymerase IV n=1 Tax=Conexibacter sp. CPCC 206217 TaxID=3064574 RepID=UPI0027234831|nr:DNA polymerase IV [Conexibacter sp. CPCC 206217]MDO8210460.1 DNA polymerase IV [Conexibacter sp. CPCC 206217]